MVLQQPLKRHLPDHESDHVLNIAFNILAGGQRLEHIELRRNDEVYLDTSGAADPRSHHRGRLLPPVHRDRCPDPDGDAQWRPPSLLGPTTPGVLRPGDPRRRRHPRRHRFATDYSYRTQRTHQQRLLSDWVAGLSALLFPQAQDFSVDFHPIPYRGDPTGLDTHYVAMQRKAGPSVLTFFAQEQESGVLCYGNANLTRDDQAGEVLRFVEFWHTLAGHDPQWLYFDSKVAP